MIKRQHYYISIITLLVICFFIGCNKEMALNPDTESPLKTTVNAELENLYNQLQIPDFGNIKLLRGGILQFQSKEHYEQVYEDLNELTEAWTTLFLETYDTGDEEELDDIIETLNFDDRTPLIKFAQKYKTVQATVLEGNAIQEEAWMERGGNGAPPMDEITACEIEQTLLSNYYEVCVGDTICQLRIEGYQIHIPTSSLRLIGTIRAASIEELTGYRGPVVGDGGIPTGPPYNSIVYPPKSTTCHKSKHEKGDKVEHGDEHYFTWSYHFRYLEFWGTVKTTATMKNYKYKSNKDKWVKDYGSSCKVGFCTVLHDECNACNFYWNFSLYQSLNLKLHSRSISLSGKGLVASPSCKRDNTSSSYIECTHRGTIYKCYVQ